MPCIECGKPTQGRRYCATHQRDEDARRNAKTVAHGVKRSHFQKLRPQVLAAAAGLCELRLDRRCTRIATTVHLDPSLEGNHDVATIDDCSAACAHCHGVADGGRSARKAAVA